MDPKCLVYELVKQRQSELTYQAKQNRLARPTPTARQTRSQAHHRLLAWLGERLIACGQRLRERYGSTPTLPPPRATRGTRSAVDIIL